MALPSFRNISLATRGVHRSGVRSVCTKYNLLHFLQAGRYTAENLCEQVWRNLYGSRFHFSPRVGIDMHAKMY